MFRCQRCHCVVPPGTPCQRIVLRRRSKAYPQRARANVVVVQGKNGKPKKEYRDDPGGRGQEIVEEAAVCAACAAS
ncbi:MAG: hypothetical protein U0793_10205 [Gemmataceae bacterium]